VIAQAGEGGSGARRVHSTRGVVPAPWRVLWAAMLVNLFVSAGTGAAHSVPAPVPFVRPHSVAYGLVHDVRTKL